MSSSQKKNGSERATGLKNLAGKRSLGEIPPAGKQAQGASPLPNERDDSFASPLKSWHRRQEQNSPQGRSYSEATSLENLNRILVRSLKQDPWSEVPADWDGGSYYGSWDNDGPSFSEWSSSGLPAVSIDLKDQVFRGPKLAKRPYASISILNQILTIERHADAYYFSCRFNIETTILGYETRPGDQNEYFFNDVCLQYRGNDINEILVTQPESGTGASFSVANKTTTTHSGTVSANLSQNPTGSVSLGLTRASELAVSYTTTSWSLSAHGVVSSSPSSTEDQNSSPHRPRPSQTARHQWFWSGNQEDTKVLTPDLKHSVKRHVVVTRRVPARKLRYAVYEGRKFRKLQPMDPSEPVRSILGDGCHALRSVTILNQIVRKPFGPTVAKRRQMSDNARAATERDLLRDLLRFDFSVQIRVKRRHGRMHRALLFSSNPVKASSLNPRYHESFCLGPDLEQIGKSGERSREEEEKIEVENLFTLECEESDDSDGTGRIREERVKRRDGEVNPKKSTDRHVAPSRSGESTALSSSEVALMAIQASLPRNETADIEALLEAVKKSHQPDWSSLQGRLLGEVLRLQQKEEQAETQKESQVEQQKQQQVQ